MLSGGQRMSRYNDLTWSVVHILDAFQIKPYTRTWLDKYIQEEEQVNIIPIHKLDSKVQI